MTGSVIQPSSSLTLTSNMPLSSALQQYDPLFKIIIIIVEIARALISRSEFYRALGPPAFPFWARSQRVGVVGGSCALTSLGLLLAFFAFSWVRVA